MAENVELKNLINLTRLNTFWKKAKTYINSTINTEITAAIEALDVDDTAVSGQYVSSVSQVDGKIVVSRLPLPAEKEYSIEPITGAALTNLGANVKEAYKLAYLGQNGDYIQAGEPIKIYKDSSLESVELVNQELVFTYNLYDGTESTVSVDISKFLAESEFGDGLQVSADGIVSVKIDGASEGFLTVSGTGIKLSGVRTAIDTAKNNAINTAKSYTDTEIAKITVATTEQINALFTQN